MESPIQKQQPEPKPVGTAQPPSEAEVWREAVRLAKEEPRITFVNKRVKTILVYLRKTVPDVSVSKIIAEIVEEAVKVRYPDLWRRVEREPNTT